VIRQVLVIKEELASLIRLADMIDKGLEHFPRKAREGPLGQSRRLKIGMKRLLREVNVLRLLCERERQQKVSENKGLSRIKFVQQNSVNPIIKYSYRK